MKKSLYVSIVLGVAALSLGTQVNHVTTVLADETEMGNQTIEQTSKSENVEPSGLKSDSEAVSQEDSSENLQPKSNEDNPVEPTSVEPTIVKNENQKASNRTNVQVGDTPYMEIKQPEKYIKDRNEVEQYNDPAYEGDLYVPYTYHGNASVYVLDENNQPILDPETGGYRTRNSVDVYGKDSDYNSVAEGFTGYVYGVRFPQTKDSNNLTTKEKMLMALGREGLFYMKFENHGYDNTADLIDYKDRFIKMNDYINSLNDDGTPVVETLPVTPTTPTKSHSHNSHHTVTQSNETDSNIDMTVTTIKRARIYTEDGKMIGHRGLELNSTWHINKISVINNQLMYRISSNEWVAASDVQ